jgi:predicted nuclease of predicted toxin-antitoxin system
VKLLLDRCVWGPATDELSAAGHDAVWTGTWPEDPGDERILAAAYAERRVLVTIDKDFGGLAVLQGLPHAGMIRLDRIPARQQASACLRAIDEHASDLEAGAIVTVERGRIRIRQPWRANGQADQ